MKIVMLWGMVLVVFVFVLSCVGCNDDSIGDVLML